MPIKNGDLVSVLYTGTFDNGEIFDSSELHEGEPIKFKVGDHQVIAGFENAVIDKELGEEVQIRLEPSEAYGAIDPEMVRVFTKKELGLDVEPAEGMQLMFQHKHGDHVHDMPGFITKIVDDKITVDINHPMAGKVLNFKLTIKKIE